MAVSEEQLLIRIKKVCGEVLKVDQGKITLESRFKEDLGADSLDIISLLMVLEDEFKSSIPDEDAAKFITVNDVVSFLKVHPGSGS